MLRSRVKPEATSLDGTVRSRREDLPKDLGENYQVPGRVLALSGIGPLCVFRPPSPGAGEGAGPGRAGMKVS